MSSSRSMRGRLPNSGEDSETRPGPGRTDRGRLGALIASGIFLSCLQWRADRDLVERRLRAILAYRDCLGDLASALEGGAGEPQALRQAWKNVAEFCREFHFTGWFGSMNRGLVSLLESSEVPSIQSLNMSAQSDRPGE